MGSCSMRHARVEPELVLLSNGDVWIRGGYAGWDHQKGQERRVAVDERWIAATTLCREEADAPKEPPADAVMWDFRARGLVACTKWPGKPIFGEIALAGGGGNVVAGGVHDVDVGKFGRRPEVESKVILRTGRKTLKLKLSTARANPTMTLLRDGRVVISGGYSVGMDYSWEDVYEGESAVDIVDPDQGVITRGSSLRGGRYRHAVLEIAPGRLLVVGGSRKDDSPMGDVEIVELR